MAEAKFVKAFTAHSQEVLAHASSHRFEQIEKVIEEFWAKQKKMTKKSKPNLSKHTALAQKNDAQQISAPRYKGIIDALMPDVFQKLPEGSLKSKVEGTVTAVEQTHIMVGGTKVALVSDEFPDLSVYATVKKDHAIKVGDKIGEVSLKKDIRNFGKKYDGWMAKAMDGFAPAFVELRMQLGLAFTQKLRRYTSLCHLAQAARQVLNNQDHVKQMKKDYGQIDFVNVQEQVAWVCEGCDAGSMKKHEEEFPGKSDENSLEKWALWLQGIVAERLGTYKDQESYEDRAAELLLRWSFISSLIMRELTLRSALSFGPFHLLRLLCDDYMFYLVEIAVAEKGCRAVHHVPGGVQMDAEGMAKFAADAEAAAAAAAAGADADADADAAAGAAGKGAAGGAAATKGGAPDSAAGAPAAAAADDAPTKRAREDEAGTSDSKRTKT